MAERRLPERRLSVRRPVAAGLTLGLVVGLTSTLGTSALVPTTAAAAAPPAAITAVTSRPGARPGEVAISWSTTGASTAYRIDTALTLFSRTDPALPREGRHFTSFTVRGGSRRSVTLSAADTTRAGAPLGSANHLYFRLYALNGSTERAYPRLQSVSVQPLPAGTGTAIRVASFNVRTGQAAEDTGVRAWSARAPYVARAIVAAHPGLAALQEVSPGVVNGTGGLRQTTSLLRELAANGGGRYAMIRTTSYAKPGTPMGTQGARILYDRDRYALRSSCPDTTDGSNWNTACTIRLPLRPGDKETDRRVAAVARFADRRTGQQFYLVSVHLDSRRGVGAAEQASFEALRGAQMRAVIAEMNAVNRHNARPLPVIIAGDINSWQNTPNSYAPHNELIARGFYDLAAARTRVNFGFSTVNGFATTLTPTASGFGSRLDVIAVQGARGANRFENVLKVTDPRRPSDHNLVYSDFRLPG